MEHLTGGYIRAGMHEVAYTEATKAAYEAAKAAGRSTWRVSSTLFTMLRNDVNILPIPEVACLVDADEAAKYPSMTAHEFFMGEVAATNMMTSKKDTVAPDDSQNKTTLLGFRKKLQGLNLGSAKTQK